MRNKQPIMLPPEEVIEGGEEGVPLAVNREPLEEVIEGGEEEVVSGVNQDPCILRGNY